MRSDKALPHWASTTQIVQIPPYNYSLILLCFCQSHFTKKVKQKHKTRINMLILKGKYFELAAFIGPKERPVLCPGAELAGCGHRGDYALTRRLCHSAKTSRYVPP
jgi:hypothetical protein